MVKGSNVSRDSIEGGGMGVGEWSAVQWSESEDEG